MYRSNLAEEAHQRPLFDAYATRIIGDVLKSVMAADDNTAMDKSVMEDYDLP